MQTKDAVIDIGEDEALIYNSHQSRSYSPLRCHRSTSSLKKSSFAKLACTLFLFGCIAYTINHGSFANDAHRVNHKGSALNEPINKAAAPIFLFGHSTGHSGTGTFHQSLLEPGCPWNSTIDEFEYLAEGERKWGYDEDCKLVKEHLIPHLFDVIEGANGPIAYVDMGHFHNRGRTLECLAKVLKQQSTFIHIRRNRYSIARSFTDSMARLAASYPEMKITPCIAKNVIHGQEYGHPHMSTCPRSTENAGPVDLPLADEAWDELSTWQQFLWYADEIGT